MGERERERESGIKRRFKNGEEGRGGFAFEFIIRMRRAGRSRATPSGGEVTTQDDGESDLAELAIEDKTHFLGRTDGRTGR